MTFPPSISKWYYYQHCCCKDKITFHFPQRLATTKTTGRKRMSTVLETGERKVKLL